MGHFEKINTMRYPMCKDQPAQIDCRNADCVFCDKGQCNNPSPAITLNPSGSFVCWSKELITNKINTDDKR